MFKRMSLPKSRFPKGLGQYLVQGLSKLLRLRHIHLMVIKGNQNILSGEFQLFFFFFGHAHGHAEVLGPGMEPEPQ